MAIIVALDNMLYCQITALHLLNLDNMPYCQQRSSWSLTICHIVKRLNPYTFPVPGIGHPGPVAGHICPGIVVFSVTRSIAGHFALERGRLVHSRTILSRNERLRLDFLALDNMSYCQITTLYFLHLDNMPYCQWRSLWPLTICHIVKLHHPTCQTLTICHIVSGDHCSP